MLFLFLLVAVSEIATGDYLLNIFRLRNILYIFENIGNYLHKPKAKGIEPARRQPFLKAPQRNRGPCCVGGA